jgi:hypothetical protein
MVCAVPDVAGFDAYDSTNLEPAPGVIVDGHPSDNFVP